MSLYSILEIERNYPNWYDSTYNLSYDDQKWIWENLPLPKESEYELNKLTTNDSILSSSLSSSGKLQENFNENNTIHLNNNKLLTCNYRTAPKVISEYLTEIFGIWDKFPEHWLYIAKKYTPKTINSVIHQMNKRINRGEITGMNYGAYFTAVIKNKHIKRSYFYINSLQKQK